MRYRNPCMCTNWNKENPYTNRSNTNTGQNDYPRRPPHLSARPPMDIWSAVASRNAHTVRDVITRGANVNAQKTPARFTPLYYAIRDHSLNIVDVLLQNNADPNAEFAPPMRLTPLMIAATEGQVDIINLLIEFGANVNATNRARQNALFFAAAQGRANAVAVLLPHVADANSGDQQGVTPLMIAAQKGFTDVIDVLLQQIPDHVNTVDRLNRTALMHAIENSKNVDTVDRLLQVGADVNIADRNSITPLMRISEKPDTEAYVMGMVDRLIVFGATIQAKNNRGETALMLAAKHGNRAIVDRLISIGDDVNTRDNEGNTPLIVAAAFGHLPIVQLLLQYQADINARNDADQTALIAAQQHNHPAVVTFLREAEVTSHPAAIRYRRIHRQYRHQKTL